MYINAIICNKETFDALNEKALKYCLEQGGIMERWCNPVIHPKTKEMAFIVEKRILPCLTTAEKNETIELTEDWFPKAEII